MTASALGTCAGTSTLVMEDVECSGGFASGLLVTDGAQVSMSRCSITADVDAVVSSGSADGTPTIVASDSQAWSTAPAWDLAGVNERLSNCEGQGLSLDGEFGLVTDHKVTGICDDYGMRLAGSNSQIIGGLIECIAHVGLWSDGAVCSRASQLTIIAEFNNLISNLDEYAIQVTGVNTDPEVMLDGMNICGPGTATVVTYGCNQAPNDCAGEPCAACADIACDDPPPDFGSCWDEACWPPEIDRLPQLFSTCTIAAGLWDVQVPIKTTRSVVLSLPQLVVGGISDIWRPGGTFDCLINAELNVWTDDPGSDVGATTVDLYDDAIPALGPWTISVGAGGTVDWEWTYHEVYGFTPLYTSSVLRAEVMEVTTPLTTVQASVTLRFP